MSQITIRVADGYVESVEDIPFGVTVRIEGYDTDGYGDEETELVDGQRARVAHYGSEAQQGNLAGIEPPNAVSALLAAADELVALHGAEPGAVSNATMADGIERLVFAVAATREEGPRPQQPRPEGLRS